MRRAAIPVILFAIMIVCTHCHKAYGVLDIGQKTGAVKLEGADGKPVVLNKLTGASILAFWVPRNDESRKGLNDLAALAKTPALKGYTIYAITRGKDDAEKKTARDDFSKNKWPFKLLFDAKLEASTHLGVKAPLPAFYIIGADHKLKTLAVRKLKGKIRTLTFADMAAAALKGAAIANVDFIQIEDDDAPNQKLIGKKPPAFSVKDLAGRTHTPTMYKGTSNLIIVFWNPACPHCRRELPRLKAFLAAKGSKYSARIIAIASGPGSDFREQVIGAVSDLAIDFPVAAIDDKNLTRTYAATSVPTMYIVNKNGIICEAMRGEHEDADKVLSSIFQDKKRMSMK